LRPRKTLSTSRDDLPRAALLMVASALLFAAMGAAVKIASASLPNAMIVFARSALGLLALLPWLVRLGARNLATRNLREHVVRGLAGLGAMYCFFYAIAHLRLADAVLLQYSLPLFLPFVESVWLGEPFPRRLWWGVGLGFLGVLVILRPGPGIFQPAALAGLGAALCAATAQVGVRRLTRTEPSSRIVFYFGVISTTVSAVPLVREWRTPAPPLWITLAALGVLATSGQLLMTEAYAFAPAARVGPFIYTSVVFAGLFDWWLFGRPPDRFTLAGAVLIAFAGALVLKQSAAAPRAPAR
jgi:drug/metabolite transporter (DMT)-like permease